MAQSGSTSRIRQPSFALLAALTLFITPLLALAQDDSVTVSAAEFHRMVYSSQLLMQMEDKPELDASLQTLLELQRRNPNTAPAALAGLLRQALGRYRTNAPACVRAFGYRDEVLAAYLDALREVPARTNFIPANLALLNSFMLRPADYATASSAELIHSGNERLLSSERAAAEREAMVDVCTRRGCENPAFGAAMDALLGPETGVVLANTVAQILSANAALSNRPTMQEMVYRSSLSGDGSVTLSTNQLKDLFALEMETMHEIINTNRALELDLLASQSDLPAYLTNTTLIQANLEREAQIRQGQWQRLAAAGVAVNQVSHMTASKLPAVGQAMGGLGRGVKSIADGFKAISEASKLMKAAACGNFVSGGLQIVGSILDIAGIFQDPNDVILEEIGQVKTMINDLSTNMNYRFDRVDQSLNQLGQSMDEVLDRLAYSINLIGEVGQDVEQVRHDLVGVQTDLHRLERHLASYVNQLYVRGLNVDFNYSLGHEATYGTPLSSTEYNSAESHFFTHARNNSVDSLSAPYLDRDYTPAGLYWELTETGDGASNRLDQNLSYVKKYLNDVLGQSTAGTLGELANPRDWFVGTYAYLQLALENPMYFRQVNLSNRLDLMAVRGRDLTNFLRSLTFAGTNINWSLYNAMLANYSAKLGAFMGQFAAAEQQYASDQGFVLATLRQWDPPPPRFTATATTVLESHAERPVVPGEIIPSEGPAREGIIAVGGDLNASGSHGLALQAGGTVAAWGASGYGQSTVPSGLSNVVALAAGAYHSLALRSNGTVVAWGANNYGMIGIPGMATNVVAIGAGDDRNLAVRADGRVVGWGYNTSGQATGVPTPGYPYSSTGLVAVAGQTLTNVVGADAGVYFSLALKADGTVVTWGDGSYGGTNVPAGLSNVMAIAAGGFHCLALLSNRTVVAWGANDEGQTNVPPGLTNVVAVAAGNHYSLALRDDGTVAAWGWGEYGQTNVPAGLSNVVAIAAARLTSLALQRDGTLVAWGLNDWLWHGPLPVPAGLSNVVAIAGGSEHCLALRADGAVSAWGDNTYGQASIPAGLTNVAAIAAGDYHSLALRADGTVVAWGTGYWDYGQSDVPAGLSNVVAIAAGAEYSVALKDDGRIVSWGRPLENAPTDLSNVVAIAAASYQCMALTMNGRIRAWGDNYRGQCNVPAAATNVIAIATGGGHCLALRADGTVVAWGNNSSGQTNVPPGLSNVVAIAASSSHSVAVQSGGNVVTWGFNYYGQCNVPAEATNVVAVAAGWNYTLFLTDTSPANDPAAEPLTFLRAPLPGFVYAWLQAANQHLLTNLDYLDLHDSAIEVSGAKDLLQAVLELGLPYTMERDDVLHGLFYGSESLAGLDSTRSLLTSEIARLDNPLSAPPALFQNEAPARFDCFMNRLQSRLDDLAATGQPELPRLVCHTLRLLNLLRDAWATVPRPAIEMWQQTGALQLTLYGEPYARYSLQYRDDLSGPGWSPTALTNLHSEQPILPPVSGGPRRFYRTALPVP